MNNQQITAQVHSSEVSTFIERYKALIEHVKAIVFPTLSNLSFIEVPDTTHWPNWRSQIYRYTMPFVFLNLSEVSIFSMLLYWLWLLILFLWLIITSAMTLGLFEYYSISNQIVLDEWYEYVLLILAITAGICGLGMYFQGFLFLTNRRAKLIARLVWLAAISSSLIYFINELNNSYPIAFERVLNNPRAGFLFFITIFLFTLPLIIYIVTFLMTTVRFLVWLLKLFWSYFVAETTTKTYHNIPKVVTEPVVQGDIQWYMVNLSQRELRTLKDWSRDNLEATEKRLVPSFWILALLGIFLNTTIFDNWLNGWANYLSARITVFAETESIYAIPMDIFLFFIIFLPAVFMLAIAIGHIYFELFKNIAIQSIIIDSCTISLYVIEQSEDKNKQKENNMPTKKRSLWSILFG